MRSLDTDLLRRSKNPWYTIAMATADKTSIRDEIDRLKQEFEQLCSEGKVSPEIRVVMNSLLVIVELILSVFLEKKTPKNSKNSSLPSLQTEKDKTENIRMFSPQTICSGLLSYFKLSANQWHARESIHLLLFR